MSKQQHAALPCRKREKNSGFLRFAGLLTWLFITMGVTALGQTATIQGEVVDKMTGELLPGATIAIEGTTQGTVTDIDGKFTLSLSSGTVKLRVSFMGYITEHLSLELENQQVTTLRIELYPDIETLEEFVVIGYGIQRKSDISGSIVSVNVDEINKIRGTNAVTALQGLAPGVSITHTSGTPGAGANINIRGITTLNTNTPLVIIDGVPGELSNVSQEEIESITILKDASAAAIYGTRAAGGVILIQTKRGKKGQDFQISYSGSYSWQQADNFLEMTNAEEYKKVYAMVASTDPTRTSPEAIANAIAAGRPVGEFNGIEFVADDYAWNYNRLENGNPVYANTDWQREMFQTAGTHQHNLMITGGGENSNMSLSLNHADQGGTLIGSDYKRSGLRLNSDITKNNLQLGQSFSFHRQEGSQFSSSGFGQMYDVLSTIPHIHLYNEENKGGYGGYFNDMGVYQNPVATALLPENTYSNEYLNLNGYLQYNFSDKLAYKFVAGFNSNNGYGFGFTPDYYVSPQQMRDRNVINESRSRYEKWMAENFITYNDVFDGVHNVDGMIGYSAERSKTRGLWGRGESLPFNEQNVPENATELFDIGGTAWSQTMASAFGRLGYNYDNKYYLQANYRYDASSVFGSGNRYGHFPSISTAWTLSNEDFFQSNLITDLKLRASYGILGNQQIPSYLYQARLSSGFDYVDGDGELIPGMIGFTLANPDIKWETTTTTNIGVDLRMFNDQFVYSLDIFDKETKDILVFIPLPLSFGGAGSQMMNAATVNNKGLEMSAQWRETRNDFSYSIGANFTTYKNEVISLGTREAIFGNNVDFNSGYVTVTDVGGSVSEFRVYKTAGIFQNWDEVNEWNQQGFTDDNGVFHPLQPNAQPGDIRFVDVDGDGRLDAEDRVKAGSPIPDFEFSFNTSLQWKGFDLYALFTGVYGNEIFNGMRYRTERMDNYWNYSKATLDAWTPDNPSTDMPRATTEDLNGNRRVSDRFIEDGSYLRLKTLQLGYTLPSEILRNTALQSCRLYLSGQNLLTFTSYSGYDPEVYGDAVYNRGIDWGRYPLFKSFILGVDIRF